MKRRHPCITFYAPPPEPLEAPTAPWGAWFWPFLWWAAVLLAAGLFAAVLLVGPG